MGASTFAQAYKVENDAIIIDEIVENTGLSIEECHSRMQTYFAAIFNDVNNTLKLDQPDRLMYKGLLDAGTINTGVITVTVPYTIDVYIKEGRLRVKATTYSVNLWSTAMSRTYQFVDAAPVAEKHNLLKTNIYKNQAIKIFNPTISDLTAIINGAKAALKNTTVEEDW